VTQIITARGYPVVDYHVITPDGFVLSLQRIPGPRGSKGIPNASKPAVLLQHGLEDNSITWVIQSPEESLGYILADAGYDVWLSNVRGNVYSTTNVHYKPSSSDFWAWSFDEMVEYDLPTVIDFVLKTGGQSQLSYVGHSQGTLMGFAGFGDKALAKKVNVFVALAPVAWVHNCKSDLLTVLAKLDAIEIIALFGVHDFTPDTPLLQKLLPAVCKIDTSLCTNTLGLLMGWDTSDLNKTRIPDIVAHEPSGTSVQNIIHWCQMIKAEVFQKYDYGTAENKKHYNQPKPPQYDPSLITIPVALFSGGKDPLADPVDVAHLTGLLKNVTYNQVDPSYSHIDYVWGVDAHTKIYSQVVSVLKKYNKP